jgi:hypothetical protein
VTEDLLRGRQRATTHDVPGSEVMAQIMEVKVVDLRLVDGILERCADTALGAYAAFMRLRLSG